MLGISIRRVCDLMLFHNGSDSECAYNFVQVLEKVLWRPWQQLDMHAGKKAWAIHWRLNGKVHTDRHQKG
jgi:hypothetical protein